MRVKLQKSNKHGYKEKAAESVKRQPPKILFMI